MYIPNTKWSWAFIIIAIVQACVCLAFESYVFAVFQLDIDESQIPTDNQDAAASINAPLKAIPTFLALYIFGFIYEVFLVYDALRFKNTIQVIGLVMLNIGLLIYGAIQLNTIQDGVEFLERLNTIQQGVWNQVRPFLIAIPCIIGICTLLMAFVAWKLYHEFAWTIWKHISADLRMKRRYLTYQIYIALLKFDFFFFLGFTIQFVVIVRGRTNAEFGLTIAAIPITILILFAAAFFTRREILAGMIGVLVLFFGGLAYFCFKLYRMYQTGFETPYLPARKELSAFAVLTILAIVMTIVNACMCCANFNKGLKPYVTKTKPTDDEEKMAALSNGSQPYLGGGVEMVNEPYGKHSGRVAPARMEID